MHRWLIIGLVYFFAENSVYSQPPKVQPRGRVIGDPLLPNLPAVELFLPGGQSGDEKVDLRTRVHSIDQDLNIWANLNFSKPEERFSGLRAQDVGLVQSELQKRANQRDTNRIPIRQAMLKPVDIADQNRLLADYFKVELEGERDTAKEIFEIVSPVEQKVFLRMPAKTHNFLAHPVGALYLEMSEIQEAEVRKRFQLYHEFTMNRMRANSEKGVVFPDGRKQPMRIGPYDKDRECFRKQMQLFAALSQSQLVRYLELNGEVPENGTLSDWLEKLPRLDRTIANDILAKLISSQQ